MERALRPHRQRPPGRLTRSSSGNSSGSCAGGGGGGGDGVDCNSAWTGDPNDVQVSTECAAACSYASVGNTQGKDAACGIVAGYGATGSCTACP